MIIWKSISFLVLLKINKPLVFFDIESTGLDIINDKIIEITILKISISGEKKIYTFKINVRTCFINTHILRTLYFVQLITPSSS